MADLLLELFSEEVPARMQSVAKEQFLSLLLAKLKEKLGLELTGESWITPRRLGIYVSSLPHSIAASSEEIRGPKTSAPDAALQGFLKKNNLKKEELEARDEYYFAYIHKPAAHVADVLGSIIADTLASFTWPKSMRWSDHQIRWVRPIHNILCLFDGKILPLVFGHLTSNNWTYGHRFMAPEKIIIEDFSDYKNKLTAAKVICTTQARKEKIRAEIEAIIAPKGLTLIDDPELLEEIAGLVEYPYVFLGEINKEFMNLPKEVLVITLKFHQKYLMLNDQNGNLAPYFIIVANHVSSDQGKEIIRGNSKVLKARLSDAQFFFNQDKKETLFSRVDLLKSLTFHQQLGSVYDKTQRVKKLAEKIAVNLKLPAEPIIRAAELSKADLVTGMVREFPELQGIMGHYYALHDKEDKEVAFAIRDHYKPQGPADSLPENLIGAIVALADKLDNLNQMFGIGIKPTGSKDPFALRRAALGILRIISHYKLALDFNALAIGSDVVQFINEKNSNR